ncbi:MULTISPECIES: purple acid phosphatase family protein [unclassified Coleofasciculus]|uniref:purple acid phosphatase family protein n=1 Tax=unclassified Coleofasciculus TaxID=2692782 RepID=UPI001880F501|nr:MULTISPECIES: metallophosphoesterase family protein [unclassified Coleofasciculus]MBE9127397.1 metallophosphoesterase family protein [Coleofasciculus sp. LEGE 07081]MBE9147177.1 metallophosphoesterase family protein [Coleofasciculus sp. LEGE 07092]
MIRRLTSYSLLVAALFLTFIVFAPIAVLITRQPNLTSAPQLLTEPFLQLPTENSVRVVWFTEFPGTRHTVAYGLGLSRHAIANSTKLTRIREDQQSRVGNQTEDAQVYQQPTMRDIWRHEAEVTGLTPGKRIPYRVTSVWEDGQKISSHQFTLTPAPLPQTPLKILLTSDHQQKPMTAANLQKVAETIGQVDAVFMAGDLVNIPDRASEWFDDNQEGAFFPVLQGNADYKLEKDGIKTTYTGGELIQHAPLFPATGNHEVMGRLSTDKSLNDQFNDPIPRKVAEAIYQKNDPSLREIWLRNNTFNTDTYKEIFTLPQSSPSQENYYALTFGDIRLVSLYITNIWRTPSQKPNAKGRFQEREKDLNNPTAWGYGQHIFEPIKKGSAQYNWLQAELNSPQFQQAKYKIVMFHHPPHSLGDNIVPPYTDPIQVIERDAEGKVIAVRYEYPKKADYIIRDVVPLLEAAGVQLVLYGHSHIWNRFVSSRGMHFLETSNVGNTYGAFMRDKQRQVPKSDRKNYIATGDPNGLEPVIPTLAPLLGDDNQPLSYIASNDITVFSILDTGTGLVSSYRFDTREPSSKVVKFDEFRIAQPIQEQKSSSRVAILLATILLILVSLIAAAWLVSGELKQVSFVQKSGVSKK